MSSVLEEVLAIGVLADLRIFIIGDTKRFFEKALLRQCKRSKASQAGPGTVRRSTHRTDQARVLL